MIGISPTNFTKKNKDLCVVRIDEALFEPVEYQ